MARNSKHQKITRKEQSVRLVVLARDDWRCQYCGYDGFQARHKMTVDHIVPQSRGGNDSPENLCACCISCNGAKGSRTVAEWRAGIANRWCVGKPLTDAEIARIRQLQTNVNRGIFRPDARDSIPVLPPEGA